MKPLLAIILAACVASQLLAAPATTTTEPAATLYATRDLTIQWERYGPDSDALLSFLRKQAAAAAPKMLNVSGNNVSDWFHVVIPVQGEKSMRLQMEVKISPIPPDARLAAREFADQMVKALEQYIGDEANRQLDDHLRPLRAAADNAKKREQDSRARYESVRSKMRDLAGREASARGVGEALSKLEDEQQKLELDVLGKTARREALEQTIAEQANRVEKKVGADPILTELQKVVDAKERRAKVNQQMAETGQVAQGEAQDAIASAAEARAKLLERKRDAMNEAGGDALSSLNRELLTLSVDLNELNARLKYVKDHLPGLRDAMAMADDVQSAEAELASARQDLHKIEQDLRQAQMDGYRAPRLIVIDSENRENPPSATGQSLFGR